MDDSGLGAFLKAYTLRQAVNYAEKATTRLQGEQPEGVHRVVAELVEQVTGEAATYGSCGVTVSAAQFYIGRSWVEDCW